MGAILPTLRRAVREKTAGSCWVDAGATNASTSPVRRVTPSMTVGGWGTHRARSGACTAGTAVTGSTRTRTSIAPSTLITWQAGCR